MKHYLVITPFFPSEDSFRGSYVYDQVNELRKQTGAKITVIRLYSFLDKDAHLYNYDGIDCIPFVVYDIPSFVFPGLFHKINLSRFETLLKQHHLSGIDFIHAHVNYPAAHLAIGLKPLFPKSKYLVQHHGLDVYQQKNGRFKFVFNKLQNKFFKKKSNKLLSQFDLNIGVSQKVLDQLSYFVTDASKPLVLYNGIDTSKFYETKADKGEYFTIGCIANFWKIKDQKTLILSAIELLKEGLKIKLKFIGSGPTLIDCKKLIPQDLEVYFEFMDEVAHYNLNTFYNHINLFVLPSYYEAYGCVYVESWATNTPFIAVKGQGIEEVMSDKMKELFLIEVENLLDLSSKIKHFYTQNVTFEFNPQLKIENTIRNFIQEIENI